jgi:hypothetical protein
LGGHTVTFERFFSFSLKNLKSAIDRKIALQSLQDANIDNLLPCYTLSIFSPSLPKLSLVGL